ncbi:hypothetical protein AAHA92_10722 [Salvia divinorum]|uniref:Uncharacterized protein n=1 Tax=Salvia divinorum TaxID=28513 RepID=A0ABD1HVM3_SALDI
MKITENKQRLRHYIGAPRRFLRRARDFYVDSLVSFDSKVGIITCPATNTSRLRKNFDSNRRIDENREKLGEMYRSMEVGRFRERRSGGYVGGNGIDRSYSIALGKIGTIVVDEQCEFQENVDLRSDHMFLRTRSHAVPRNYGFH